MRESLVDDDGYPRNDIDVYQVRHARHQINTLQNDLKSLLKEIEKGLEGECDGTTTFVLSNRKNYLFLLFNVPAIHAESLGSGHKGESYSSSNANDMEVVDTPLNPFVRGECSVMASFFSVNIQSLNENNFQSIS